MNFKINKAAISVMESTYRIMINSSSDFIPILRFATNVYGID